MRKLFFLMVAIVVLAVVGCGKEPQAESNKRGKVLYSITDAKGRVIEFDKEPQRVFPVSRAIADVVVDILEPERIVAVTEEAVSSDSIVAEKAKRVKKVVARIPAAETVMQLKPDLIIMPLNTDLTRLKAYESVGIKVVLTEVPRTVPEMRQRVEFIAKILHKEEAGKKLVAKMDEKLQALEEAKVKLGSNKRVLLAYSNNGAFGRKGGLFDNLCETAGIINGAGTVQLKRLDHLSKEQVIAINPDMLLLPKNMRKGQKNNFAEEVLADPAFANLKAFKERKYIQLDEKFYKYNISHYAADAAYMLGKAVYPEYVRDVEILNY